jgi:hypothetical protein
LASDVSVHVGAHAKEAFAVQYHYGQLFLSTFGLEYHQLSALWPRRQFKALERINGEGSKFSKKYI